MMLYELIVIVFCSSSLRVFEDTIGMTDSSDSYIRTDNDSVARTDEEDAELYDNHPKVDIMNTCPYYVKQIFHR